MERTNTVLEDYHQFEGLMWDISPIGNVLDYQGVTAPHTGKPLSEAMLMGIGGGIVAGYFTFEYSGLDPWLHFLTRNTFEPMEKIIDRLGIPTQVKQTDNPEKGVKNLTDALEAGKPAIVWADIFSFDYSNMPGGTGEYMMMPLVVYGYDAEANTVHIADRAHVPLKATTDTLAAARARVKKDKHRVMTLEEPDISKLPEAVEAGIRETISGFLDAPPLAPLKGKYGLDAFKRWADLLTDTKGKKGWVKAFPPGAKMYSVLKSAFHYINLWGTGGSGGRGMYADFLDEAANVLDKPALTDVAKQYRITANLWDEMTTALLPDAVAPFKETRELIVRDYQLFVEQGAASVDKRKQISARLKAIRDEMASSFPLNDREAAVMREDLHERVLKVHDAEKAAVLTLREVM